MKYAIKITEENKDFVAYFFNNGIVPKVEEIPTALVFSDEGDSDNVIVHEWDMIDLVNKKFMIHIFEVREAEELNKTEDELKDALVRMDHIRERMVKTAQVYSNKLALLEEKQKKLENQLEAITSKNGADPEYKLVNEEGEFYYSSREERNKLIKKFAKQGYSNGDIAQMFGLSNQRISQIRKS